MKIYCSLSCCHVLRSISNILCIQIHYLKLKLLATDNHQGEQDFTFFQNRYEEEKETDESRQRNFHFTLKSEMNNDTENSQTLRGRICRKNEGSATNNNKILSGLHVCINAGHGMGGIFVPILQKLGAKVTCINTAPNGLFFKSPF